MITTVPALARISSSRVMISTSPSATKRIWSPGWPPGSSPASSPGARVITAVCEWGVSVSTWKKRPRFSRRFQPQSLAMGPASSNRSGKLRDARARRIDLWVEPHAVQR